MMGLSPRDMYTYATRAPLRTHWRKATCKEAQCDGWTGGWRTVIDVSTVLGQTQAEYIRKVSGRRFTESREGFLITFTFEAGQPCFRSGDHRVRLDRPLTFLRYRGVPGAVLERRVHSGADAWLDDFQSNQDGLLRAVGG